MKKIISNKTVYLLILLVICLGMLIVSPSLAKFASNFSTEEDVVGLTFSFNIGISNIEEYEEVTVEPNSYQVFNVNVANSSGSTAYYGIWYKMIKPKKITDDITIARLDGTEIETSGSLNSNEDQTATIIIKNLSSDSVKVNIGVNSSTTSTSDIEYLGGKYLITGTSLEADYYYDNTNSRYVSVEDNTVVFTASTTNFSYTGGAQTFTAPVAGAYKIEAWGAQGGTYSSSLAGGKGAYTSGVVQLNNQEQLYVYVGGKGGEDTTALSNPGGYNGGGYSGSYNGSYSMGGGGATDIRLVNGTWNNISGLTSRIMVASGGGGSVSAGSYTITAGYGGSLVGQDGYGGYLDSNANATAPTGGTQVSGGIGNTTDNNGYFGYGLKNLISESAGWGGGGGSGYYAGATGFGSGGAGGSSYVSGYKGAVSAGNPQKFKIVYKSDSVVGYDEYNNVILSGTPTGSIRNIDRTLNYIGKSNWTTGSDEYLYGQLFNFKITLADGTVVLHYDFTKNSVNDLSGNDYHGTLMNGASLKYDGKRYALVLDGIDDYVQVPTLPSSIDFASGFTIEFEIIWNKIGYYARLFDFGNGAPSDNIVVALYGSSDFFYIQGFNETTAVITAYANGGTVKTDGTNYGKDNEVCETGDSDISCSYHYSGKIFKKANMIAGNASMPTHDGSGTMTGNSGNGYAKITLAIPTIEENTFSISYGETLKKSDITCVDNGSGCKIIRLSPGDTSNLSSGNHDIQIMVIDDYGVVYQYTKTITVGDDRVNSPNLDNLNLIPVYYDANTVDTDGGLGVWKKADITNENSSWYNYNNKKWANAILISDSNKRETYQNATVNTVIPISDISAFYVWIPRYKYKVWNITRQGGAESTYGYNAYSEGIQIEWEEGTASTGNVSCSYNVDTVEGEDNLSDTCTYNGTTITTESSNKVDAWYTHPAFNFGGTPKTGFWIGKFETSGSADIPKIVPDATALTNQTVDLQFTSSKVFQTYGLSSNVDAHMLTNLEWGAVAYLSHSDFGLCDGNSCRDAYINNSSSKYTGRSGGYLAGDEKLQLTKFYGNNVTEDTTMYNENGYYTYKGYKIGSNGIISTTDKNESKVASTTGNVTGVYDMSGGAREFVMGNMVDSTGAFYPSYSGTSWNGTSTLNSKYYNNYSYSRSNYYLQIAFNRARLGDATAEVIGAADSDMVTWKPGSSITGVYSHFTYINNSWFIRGGYYIYSDTSLFSFGRSNGNSNIETSFRSSIS